MKRSTFFLLSVLLITVNNLQAQNNYSLSVYKVAINGTSNLHDWNESVKQVSGKGIVNQQPDKNFTLQSFSIVMQVSSINSTEGSVMNGKTYKALKGDKFPAITFLLTTPVTNVPSGANGYTVTAKGNLTIAGVTKAVSIPIKISEDAQQKILIEGSSPVKMTDYGIDPPTALFGMLKTANDITISFNTTFLSSTN